MGEAFDAFVAGATDGDHRRGVTEWSLDRLPGDGALVAVEWSSVNYKDALASTPEGKVARISPIIPGIDLAGRLVEAAGDLPAGTPVLAHGYDIGVARHGGFARFARVPVEWLVPLPDGLDAYEAMVLGTAGFTAGMSVLALLDRGIAPGDGPVLVTGATGGVGSVAVNILAGLGFEVTASTGKPESEEYLTGLGAKQLLARQALGGEVGKPLDRTVWAAVVDCVGGVTLANALSQVSYGGVVAASGLTGGAQVPTTVMPFILRGVSLIGIDSVQAPMEVRREIWRRLATDLKPASLAGIASVVGLDELDGVLTRILRGQTVGRVAVRL